MDPKELLRNKLADHLGSIELANKVVELFATVHYRRWCEREDCFSSHCTPTHSQFIVDTIPEELNGQD